MITDKTTLRMLWLIVITISLLLLVALMHG